MNDNFLWQLLGYITPLVFLAAIFILWQRSRSQALMISLIAQIVVVGFRLVLAVTPTILASVPAFGILWGLSSLISAVGLFIYALETRAPTHPPEGTPL